MPVNKGDLVTAESFNQVVEKYNKFWSDIYSSSASTNTDKSNHGYGWGQNSVEPTVAPQSVIVAEDINRLIAQVNAGFLHNNAAITPLPMFSPGTPIYESNLNDLSNRIDLLNAPGIPGITPAARYAMNPAFSDKATEINDLRSNSLNWTRVNGFEQLRLTVTSTFITYIDARHFFNAGGSVFIDMALAPTQNSSPEPGYFWWESCFALLGEIRLSADGVYTDGTNTGISLGGFYDLIEGVEGADPANNFPTTSGTGANTGLVSNDGWTQLWYGYPPINSGNAGAYGGGTGGAYTARRIVLEARLVTTAAGVELAVRVTLIDEDIPSTYDMDLNIEADAGYYYPDVAPTPDVSKVTTSSGNYVYQFLQVPVPTITAAWGG